jgi:hypothetical protein
MYITQIRRLNGHRLPAARDGLGAGDDVVDDQGHALLGREAVEPLSGDNQLNRGGGGDEGTLLGGDDE